MSKIIQLTDLGAEGFSTVASDSAGWAKRMQTLLDGIDAFLLAYTGFQFWADTSDVVYRLDGTGTERVRLPQPVISLTSVTEDGGALTLYNPNTNSGDYVLYNRRPPDTDDRFFARLEKQTTAVNMFERGGRLATLVYWNPGTQNIVVTGKFGFTDLISAVESPPLEIKRVALKLVRYAIPREGVDEEVAARRMERFATSLHAGQLDVAFMHPMMRAEVGVGMGPTFDPDIDDILNRYKNVMKAQRSPFAFGGA